MISKLPQFSSVQLRVCLLVLECVCATICEGATAQQIPQQFVMPHQSVKNVNQSTEGAISTELVGMGIRNGDGDGDGIFQGSWVGQRLHLDVEGVGTTLST